MNCVNFALLASCFRACAAAVSKAMGGLLESERGLWAGWVSRALRPLLELEEKVWPAPEV